MTRQRPVRGVLYGLALAGMMVGVAGCAGTPAGTPSTEVSPKMEHIHGLGVDPTSGSIYVATHSGMFEIEMTKDSVPVDFSDISGPIAGRAQDTMGFTMSHGRMWGSGHPDPDDRGATPSNLGLIVSDDLARTWQNLSLPGEADFHDIAVAPASGDSPDAITVYGIQGSTGVIFISTDGGERWTTGATLAARDLTVGVQGEIYATTAAGLMVSRDGARSFAIVDGAPALYLVDTMADVAGLVGLDTSGAMWTRDASGTWRATGKAPGTVEALTYSALPSPTLVVAGDAGVSSSSDAGTTWRTRAQDVNGD